MNASTRGQHRFWPVAIPLAALAAWACKPACPEYWEAVCKTCGDTSPACTRAKEVGDTLKGKDDECRRTAESFLEKANGEVFKRRYCNRYDRASDPDLAALTKSPWICNGVRVVFGERTFKHGDELHEMTSLDISRFQLTNGPAYKRRPDDGALFCDYDLGPQDLTGSEEALALDCPEAVGLPSGWQVCLREKP